MNLLLSPRRLLNTSNFVLETVENRRLLTALSLAGTSSSDSVVVNMNGDQIEVTLNGTTTAYPDADYTAVNLDMLEGNDTVEVIANGDNAVSVWGGDGDDTLRIGTGAAHAEASFSSGKDADYIYVNPDGSGTAVGRLLLEEGNKLERLQMIDVRYGGLYEIPQNLGYASLVTDDEELYGTVDINDNSWILKDGPSGTPGEWLVRNVLLKGYAGGGWNGGETSIRSSYCFTSPELDALAYGYSSQIPTRASFNGVPISGNDVLMAYTLAGDVNFDFKVDFTDILAVAQKYGIQSGGRWVEGDIDYNGLVDFNDLILFGQNYGKTLPSGPASKIGVGVVRKVTAATSFANVFASQKRVIDSL